MFEIVEKNELANNIFEMKVLAPRVAQSALPGQLSSFALTRRANAFR